MLTLWICTRIVWHNSQVYAKYDAQSTQENYHQTIARTIMGDMCVCVYDQNWFFAHFFCVRFVLYYNNNNNKNHLTRKSRASSSFVHIFLLLLYLRSFWSIELSNFIMKNRLAGKCLIRIHWVHTDKQLMSHQPILCASLTTIPRNEKKYKNCVVLGLCLSFLAQKWLPDTKWSSSATINLYEFV